MDNEDYYEISLLSAPLGLMFIVVGICFLTQSWIYGFITLSLGITIFVISWYYIHHINKIEKLELIKINNDLKNDLIYERYIYKAQKFNDFSPGKVTDHDHNKKI